MGLVKLPLNILLLCLVVIILSMSYYDDGSTDTNALLTYKTNELPFGLSVGAALAFAAVAVVLFLVIRKRM